ncbi:MAG: TolC family protein [Myxococcota bacterium]
MHVLVLSLLLAAAPDTLPEPLTLEALQQAARAASPALKASAHRQASLGQQSDAAGALPAPELMAQVWRPPLTQPWNLSESSMVMVTLSQRFPGWGVRGAKEEALQAAASVEDARRGALELEVDRQVANTFADYREAHARHAIHSKHLEVLGRIVEVAEARVASGGKLDDVAQAQREQARLEADVAVEFAGIARSAARLNALLGRGASDALGAPAPHPLETVRATTDELVAAALAARPERRWAEGQQRAQSATARAARQEALAPAVSVGLSYFPPIRMAPSHGLGLSVGLELPWLWGGKAAGRAAEETMSEAAREEVADAAFRVRVEVATALATVREATVRVEALEKTARPAAERAFDTAFASYRSGQGDVLTLLAAQRAIVELRVDLVEARATLEHALAELDWAVGGRAPRTPLAD